MAHKKELSHAEVWDDSSLINAWDTALQEYKKYHSLQAIGHSANPVSPAKEAQNEEVEMEDGLQPQQLPRTNDSGEMVEISEPILEHIETPQTNEGSSATVLPSAEPDPIASKAPNPPPFPPTILANENEALRNLMISWYFAGYYTGYYEGQQQQQHHKHREP